MKWIPEIAAFVAACIIGVALDFNWLEFLALWVAFDLMTASRKQIDALKGGRS